MALHEVKAAEPVDDVVDLFAGPVGTRPLPKDRMPARPSRPEAVYLAIH
ncbi:hypothetical protein ABZU75_06185 [Streptosporangium sp. NPDC005286]